MSDRSNALRFQNKVLFSPGRIVATPGALQKFEEHDVNPLALLSRHITGDWGECDAEDKSANDQAVRYGTRILSVYRLDDPGRGVSKDDGPYHRPATPTRGLVVWCITEANRSFTTFLLPDEY